MTAASKSARDMTADEYQAALRALKRPPPQHVPVIEQDARTMTAEQYAEAKRRLGIRTR